ncbi:hypothetical protein [Engelhardtia mirabilis]|uniref:Uncharacterized protein n=1 Tax=Engelhardtia mirabilis TaxID=2528011 RepID=A0A518BS02_9BACT|nr:hypothetical protein Pla133_48730 [Planctomycetes bacterium Pla133]QDV04077.1 hypothetical protein Pla86_48710 [Planctomycetes bacterium Pla86]
MPHTNRLVDQQVGARHRMGAPVSYIIVGNGDDDEVRPGQPAPPAIEVPAGLMNNDTSAGVVVVK